MNISSSFYNNNLQTEMDKVSKQLTTGNKISQGYEDATTFKKTIDLESDIAVTSHLQESAESAKAFTQYTDTTLDSMTKGLDQFKVKLLAYAGTTHSTTSREALVGELKSIKGSLVQLSNTQVNGEFIFGGTENKTPPIDLNGKYQGNDQQLSIKIDKFQTQEYSIDGAGLFLGYDRDIQSKVSTNVKKLSQTDLALTPPKETYINGDHSILDLTGKNESTTFYMSGTKPDGSGFKHKFTVDNPADVKVSDLAEEIKLAFGDDVTVDINSQGQFVIQDKKSGNAKMNFNMIGSTENVEDISELDKNQVIEFVKNGNDDPTIGEALNFKKDGNLLTNNIQQFISVNDGFATENTKLSDVSSSSLLNETFQITGKNVNGEDISTSLTFGEETTTVQINGSSVELQGGADSFTYKQLTEVISVSLSGVEVSDFSTAVLEAEKMVDVSMNHRGEFEIRDLTSSTSKMEFAMFDSKINDFSTNQGSALSFNSNRAVTLDNPSIDFFDSLDKAIEAVEQDLMYSDGTRVGFEDNRGVQGALDNITHLTDHIIKERAESGAQMQNIQYTLDRTEALTMNMKITKNDVVSTDFAEASAYFQSLSMNYQAMLSTVAKVQGISLLNYL